MSDRVGYWADMEHPYITYEDDYIESEWWCLKKIYEKGLLYQGPQDRALLPPLRHRPVQPRGGAGLQEREGNLRRSCCFKVKGEENTYLLAWTTTPWTLPSNLALCVNPHETYCRITAARASTTSWARRWFHSVFGGKEVTV